MKAKNPNAIDPADFDAVADDRSGVSERTCRRIVIAAQHFKNPSGGRTAGHPLAR